MEGTDVVINIRSPMLVMKVITWHSWRDSHSDQCYLRTGDTIVIESELRMLKHIMHNSVQLNEEFRLFINAFKTKVMVFSKRKFQVPLSIKSSNIKLVSFFEIYALFLMSSVNEISLRTWKLTPRWSSGEQNSWFWNVPIDVFCGNFGYSKFQWRSLSPFKIATRTAAFS